MSGDILIIILMEFLVILPIQIAMTILIFDGFFHDGSNPYNRMSTVLDKQDRIIFDVSRTQQINSFKRNAIIINAILLIQFLVLLSLIIFEFDPESSQARLITKMVNLSFFILFIFVIIYVISYHLNPQGLRSMISVVKSKGYQKELVHSQVYSFNRFELLRNKDAEILVRSYFNNFYKQYSSYHEIALVNYSIFKKEKNGTHGENVLTKMYEDDRTATQYLTRSILPDMKFTSLWITSSKIKILIFITIILEIFAVIFLFIIDQSDQLLLITAIILVMLPAVIFIIPLRILFLLTPVKVEQILIENNIEYSLDNKYHKLIELIEEKYPYVSL